MEVKFSRDETPKKRNNRNATFIIFCKIGAWESTSEIGVAQETICLDVFVNKNSYEQLTEWSAIVLVKSEHPVR